MLNIQKFATINSINLSASDKKVVDYLNKHSNHIPSLTIQKFADGANTSIASVQRFCKKIGFNGYNEFKFQFKNFLNQENKRHNKEDNYFKDYAKVTEQFANLNTEAFDKLVKSIKKANQVFTFGIYYSSLPANMLKMALTDLNINCEYGSDVVTESHDLNLFSKEKDIFIYFSVSAEDSYFFKHYFKDTIPSLDQTYLITFNDKSELKTYFKNAIILPGKQFVSNNYIDPQSLVCLVVEYLVSKLTD